MWLRRAIAKQDSRRRITAEPAPICNALRRVGCRAGQPTTRRRKTKRGGGGGGRRGRGGGQTHTRGRGRACAKRQRTASGRIELGGMGRMQAPWDRSERPPPKRCRLF